jgi:LacI family transcriptional regulator
VADEHILEEKKELQQDQEDSEGIKASEIKHVKARPTMQDVAQVAGVSLKTVSRVVNKEPLVNEETRVRVEEAIRKLGFRRNDIARSLRQGQTSLTIGLVIEDIANPFYAHLARGVEQVALRNNHMLIISSSEEKPERERELVNAMLLRRVSGLLIVPAGLDHSYLKGEMQLGTPAIFLDRPPANLDADTVLLDSYSGAHIAIEHLLRFGHRRIGLICGDPTVYTGARRVAGYRAALKEWDIEADEELLCFGCDEPERAKTAVQRLLSLQNPPTALFTTNNRISIAVLYALRAHTHQLAFISFDDFELAEMLPMPISVITHNPAEMGRQAAELLFARLEGDDRPAQRILLATKLIARGSGELPPNR